MARRNHEYRLLYHGLAPDETVKAPGPTEAVARRKASILPSGVSDVTAVRAWVDRMRAPAPAPVRPIHDHEAVEAAAFAARYGGECAQCGVVRDYHDLGRGQGHAFIRYVPRTGGYERPTGMIPCECHDCVRVGCTRLPGGCIHGHRPR